jgi:hypothetical protein
MQGCQQIVPPGCNNGGNGGGNGTTCDMRNVLIAWVGGAGTNSIQLSTTNMYIQYIRVWSCAGWNSNPNAATGCDGTNQYSGTASNGVTYYYYK